MRMSQELTKHSVWLHRTSQEDDTDECPLHQENNRRLKLLLNELKVMSVITQFTSN